MSEFCYIRSEIGHYLKMHDGYWEYFIPLCELATELDCMINAKNKPIN